MAAFDYTAINHSGKQIRGTLEADSSRQARQLLRDKQLLPLDINEAASKHKDNKKTGLFAPSMSVTDLALVTRQMATLIQASLPLEETLNAIAQQADNPRIRSIMLSVRSKVLEGHSLAHAMAEFPRAFSHLYRATVSAGEHSGHLDLVMNRLADHTENAHAFRQKVKMAMIYPMLLVIVSIGIVSGLMVYVVPKVVSVFTDTGEQLPALTQAMIDISDFIKNYGLMVVAIIVLGSIAFNYAMRSPGFKMRVHQYMLQMPFVKRMTRGFNTARYTSTLSILTSSGVPLVDAMRIASEVVSNVYLQKQLRVATQRVEEGMSLNKALGETGYFPPMALHMIASGENSGELDSMLDRTATYQETSLQNLVTVMVSLFEPFMLLFMGVCVGVIVMAILLPILNLNQLAG